MKKSIVLLFVFESVLFLKAGDKPEKVTVEVIQKTGTVRTAGDAVGGYIGLGIPGILLMKHSLYEVRIMDQEGNTSHDLIKGHNPGYKPGRYEALLFRSERKIKLQKWIDPDPNHLNSKGTGPLTKDTNDPDEKWAILPYVAPAAPAELPGDKKQNQSGEPEKVSP